jgi:hypothetical protein
MIGVAGLSLVGALAAASWGVIDVDASVEKVMFACLVIGLVALSAADWMESTRGFPQQPDGR